MIVGDDGVMVIDTRATPLMAREVIKRIHRATSKPDKYVVLSHYHVLRVLDVSRAYDEAGGIKHPRIWTARRDIEMWKSIA